jgi:hypothetical protein
MFGFVAPEASDQPARPRRPFAAPGFFAPEPQDAPAETFGFNGLSANTQATVVAAPAAMACAACATMTPAVAP